MQRTSVLLFVYWFFATLNSFGLGWVSAARWKSLGPLDCSLPSLTDLLLTSACGRKYCWAQGLESCQALIPVSPSVLSSFFLGGGGVGWKLYLPFLIFSLLVGISFCFSMHFVPNDSPITIKFICCLFTKISDTEPSFLNFKKREALSYRLLPSGIKDFKILWMREGFPGGIVLKNPPANAGYARVAGLIPGLEDPLEEKMATYSTIPGKFHG